jgi:hypothetical protein
MPRPHMGINNADSQQCQISARPMIGQAKQKTQRLTEIYKMIQLYTLPQPYYILHIYPFSIRPDIIIALPISTMISVQLF